MARFTIRVELHGATETQYAKLHEAMANAGMQRYILAGDGSYYPMPTAEYDLPESIETAGQVATRVAGIAAFFQPTLRPPRKAWVFVTSGQASWSGIDPLPKR